MTDHETNAELRPPAPDTDAECLIEFASRSWQSTAPGLRVKQVGRGNQRIRLVEFSEDFVEADWCLGGHSGYVIEGTLEIDFSGKQLTFHAGDGLCIPAGETWKHKARVPKGKAILFLVEETNDPLPRPAE